MMAKRFGFGRAEKLKSRKSIEELFAQGRSFPAYPLRVVYRFLPAEQGSIQAGVSVSKRYFKKAVDRNRLKRLMREAYRLQKGGLKEKLEHQKKQGLAFFMFNGKAMAGLDEVKQAMKKCLDHLEKSVMINENPS
jgi:ribonuclease P protein component